MPPTPQQQDAIDRARNYVGRGPGVFFNIRPADFLNDLVTRIERPELINQENAAVCGPATFLFNLARSNPVRYAAFACHLFMLGRAPLRKLLIKASDRVKNAGLLHNMSPADWVTLASLRLNRNWFFKNPDKLDSVFFTGVTWPTSVAKWFREAGYTSTNETNIKFTKGWDNWHDACTRFGNGELVCLFINANMLNPATAADKSSTPNHWVGLESVVNERGPVHINVFTWGGVQAVVFHTAGEYSFKRHYYGYVSAL